MSWKPAPWFKGKEKKKLKPVRSVSASRSARLKVYYPLARAFIANLNAHDIRCPVVTALGLKASSRITDVHHMFGRDGDLLCFKAGWLGISRAGHIWIDANRDEARKRKWLAPVGLWNNPRKVMQIAHAVTSDSKMFTRMMDLL